MMISNMGSFLLVDQVAVLPAKFDPVFSFCLAVIESGRRGGFPEDGRYQVRQGFRVAGSPHHDTGEDRHGDRDGPHGANDDFGELAAGFTVPFQGLRSGGSRP